MGTLRRKESEERYQNVVKGGALERGCVLCSAQAIQTFSHWKVIHNDYPYDKIAEVHDMLVPLRHITEEELSAEEKQDLAALKAGYLNLHYQYLIESFPKNKSIPDHFHLHLVVVK